MCAFLVSPGVQVLETDLTNVVPAVSASIGGYAGNFSWGPVDELTLVSSEKDLADKFGTPTSATAKSFFTAASFLKYGNVLKTIRAVEHPTSGTVGSVNAITGLGSGVTAKLIKNKDDYDTNFSGGGNNVGSFAAKYPGTLGNSLAIEICPAMASEVAFKAWAYASQFNGAPGTSDFVAARGGLKDELHIVVVDALGKFTGTPGTVLEKFAFASQASNALAADGSSNYFKNVLNNKSKYIWWMDNTFGSDLGTNTGAVVSDTLSYVGTAIWSKDFAGGTDGNVDNGDVITALDVFRNAETVDANLLFAGCDASAAVTLAAELISIAEGRKDLMVFISPPIEATTTGSAPAAAVATWAAGVTSTSYAVLDSTALKVYDKYNDVYRWIPACGHIAGLCAKTDTNADAWFSPAGFNRGQLLGVTKLAFNPNQAERDELYKARVNPLVSFPGQGMLLYGDKTALAKPSAFDRINVRRLFIILEKAISTAAKYQLFEFNDEFTRSSFRNLVSPFLREVRGRRGLTNFAVVCDETNNTGDVISRNEFRADIYVKPNLSINFITLNFVATRQDVAFNEIIGRTE